MEIRDQITQLIAEADDFPSGDSRLDLLNQAVRLASTHQIEDLEFEAKFAYSDECISSGRSERILQHFPWLLAYADREQNWPVTDQVLWLYEWAIITLADVSRIEKKSILEALADLEDRMHRHGTDPLKILDNRRICRIALGDVAEATAAHEEIIARMQAQGITLRSSDHNKIYGAGFVLEKLGKNEASIEMLSPLMESKKKGDFFLLSRTLMMMPLAYLGKMEQAMRYMKRVMKEVEYTPYYVPCHGDMMAFLGATGNWEKGMQILQKSLKSSEENQLEIELASYYRGACYTLASVPEEHRAEYPLQLPEKHPFPHEGKRINLMDLHAHYHARLEKILSAFDKRNENTFMSEYFHRWDAWLPNIPAYSLD
jgi:tetratricopeptide (TPR) repeat protein